MVNLYMNISGWRRLTSEEICFCLFLQLFNAEGKKISNDKYIAGDACRRSADGYFCITGRIDDVINVSGHRIGTAELESALGKIKNKNEDKNKIKGHRRARKHPRQNFWKVSIK